MATCTNQTNDFEKKSLLSCDWVPNESYIGEELIATVKISEKVIYIGTVLVVAAVAVAVGVVATTVRGATCGGGVYCSGGVDFDSGSGEGQGHFDISRVTKCCSHVIHWCKCHTVCLLSVMIEIAIVGAVISMYRKMDGTVLWLTFLSVIAWLHVPCAGPGNTRLKYCLLTRSLWSPAIIIV